MTFLSLVLAPRSKPRTLQLPALAAARSRHLAIPATRAFDAQPLLREGPAAGAHTGSSASTMQFAVSLDTATHVIAGRETKSGTRNRSPDTLSYIWLQLDQNLFRDDGRGACWNPPDARFARVDFRGGFVLDRVESVRTVGRQTVRRASKRQRTAPHARSSWTEPRAARRHITRDRVLVSSSRAGADRMDASNSPRAAVRDRAVVPASPPVYDDVAG